MKALRIAAGAALYAALATPLHAAEGGGGDLLLKLQQSTLTWTLITFVVMLFILGRYAWKPLLGALEQRENSIRESIEQATTDRAEAEALLAQHRELLDQSRRERAEALALGQRDAEQLKAEILEEARKERERMLEQAGAQVETGMRQAQAELRGLAVGLAVEAAGKLLRENLDDSRQRKLVEDYLADLDRAGGPGSLPS